ncbi:MAG: DNA translocase FtsK 4TM domain-containing protein [Abditibacteriota bacterium]|nr:DNA translocase FtsK 4TM domain-containing protein [Abditibacteriota bacterium]
MQTLAYVLLTAGPVLFIILCFYGRGGIIGDGIARFFRSLLGFGAYPLALSLIYFGLSHFRAGQKGFERKRIWGTVFFLFAFTVLCGLLLPGADPENRGGLLGRSMDGFLHQLFGVFSYFVGIALLVCSLFILSDRKAKDVFGALRDLFVRQTGPREKSNDNIIDVRPDGTTNTGTLTQRGRTPITEEQPVDAEPSGPKPLPQNKKPIREIVRGGFTLPPTDLLEPTKPVPAETREEIETNKRIIEDTLADFNVDAQVVRISSGPTVSRYEVQLAQGIKVSTVTGLEDNLAMNLAAVTVRIEAPIPGKNAIGVEVPNKVRGIVGLRGILESELFQKSKAQLPFVLGADVAGNPKMADLAKMPHLLIAGATGSGKSVGINTLITSLLYRLSPDELRLILVDPKRVELSLYEGIPHLAHPVVKDAKLAAGVLESLVQEMTRRYKLLEQEGCRKIDIYNSKVGEEDKMPYMVVVIDELADLMMQCAKNVENSICRLAQLSRAVGIHLVVATQRPSVDIITGKIKANIPSRIAFSVSSYIDSKTIIDTKGAESLIGYGDMLYSPVDEPKPVRIQGCFLSENEIIRLCDYLREQREPSYEIEAEPISSGGKPSASGGDEDDGNTDEYWNDALRIVVRTKYCSTSILQRKFSIGYNRAARIVDRMEQVGVVGPQDGSKARQVLITEEQLNDYLIGSGSEE